jgi:hypothetical protein
MANFRELVQLQQGVAPLANRLRQMVHVSSVFSILAVSEAVEELELRLI